MLNKYARPFFAKAMSAIVHWLRNTGITPNIATTLGFVLTIVTALVLASGHFFWAGILLFCAGFFDMLDGALARIMQQSSAFGAFLDSTMDRYSESATFFALAYYYSNQPGMRTELMLIFMVLIGSLMVSYVKARAEALRVECKDGFLQRPERVVLMIIALIIGWLPPVLWIMAIFTNVTAIQRIYEVYWRMAAQENHPRSTPNKLVKTKNNSPVQG